MSFEHKWLKRLLWIVLPPVLIIACYDIHDRRWKAANSEEREYTRITSPGGRYLAIATYPRWEEQVMRFPGQGGDKSGFITILDRHGVNYGSIPVPMVSFIHDLRWSEHGARLGDGGGRDFRKREVDYWDDALGEYRVKHAK